MANTTGTNEIEFLENRIAKLDSDSFSTLRDWLIEFDQARWDKKLEADSNAGKLDFLINAAFAEHQADKTRLMRNMINGTIEGAMKAGLEAYS